MTYLIMELWLKLTDIAGTSIGKKIDDLIFIVIGIVLLLFVGSKILGVMSTPFMHTVDEELENKRRSPGYEICCDNCIHYDRYRGKCDRTQKDISDASHRSCSFFLNERG